MHDQSTARYPLADRFWPKVSTACACWLWTASTDRKGYGQISMGGRSGRPVGAHRVAWFLATGHWPTPPEAVCHDCPGGDNPLCVRNDTPGCYVVDGVSYEKRGHLWLGNVLANNADMAEKGRSTTPPHSIGAANPMAKLNADQVLAIRLRYATGMVLQRQLADEYGVARGIISRIVRGLQWNHVAGPITEGWPDGNPNVTQELVLAVHAAVASGRFSHRALGREFGISRSVIKTIVDGRFDR